ncbi:hypothetical protein GGX14DRAFT_580848 [Mycena pura]|uniref:Uncharacterized protein n=1 Tax=Mycena pura TaxID=153505 RepID=A0AAD6Y0S9_9AGAR|nr:hypothetical protein GGX14DRAFT_580848 [Mycena pura]
MSPWLLYLASWSVRGVVRARLPHSVSAPPFSASQEPSAAHPPPTARCNARDPPDVCPSTPLPVTPHTGALPVSPAASAPCFSARLPVRSTLLAVRRPLPVPSPLIGQSILWGVFRGRYDVALDLNLLENHAALQWTTAELESPRLTMKGLQYAGVQTVQALHPAIVTVAPVLRHGFAGDQAVPRCVHVLLTLWFRFGFALPAICYPVPAARFPCRLRPPAARCLLPLPALRTRCPPSAHAEDPPPTARGRCPFSAARRPLHAPRCLLPAARLLPSFARRRHAARKIEVEVRPFSRRLREPTPLPRTTCASHAHRPPCPPMHCAAHSPRLPPAALPVPAPAPAPAAPTASSTRRPLRAPAACCTLRVSLSTLANHAGTQRQDNIITDDELGMVAAFQEEVATVYGAAALGNALALAAGIGPGGIAATIAAAVGPAVANAVGPAIANAIGPAVANTVGPAIAAAVGPAVANALVAVNQKLNAIEMKLNKSLAFAAAAPIGTR